MIQVDTRAYIFETIIDIFCFYGFFSFWNNQFGIKRKINIGIIFIPIYFLGYTLFGIESSLFFMLTLYLVFKKQRIDLKLANIILFSACTVVVSSILVSTINVYIFKFSNQSWGIIIFSSFLEIIFTTFITWGGNYIKYHNSTIINDNLLLLGIVQSSFLIIIYFYAELAHKFKIFDRFAIGTLIFVLIEFLVMLSLLIYFNAQTKRHYKNKLDQQQLDNLRAYTAQLEESQSELRKFRHDYNNILLSINELANESNNKDLINYLLELNIYSKEHLRQQSDAYQDLQNIKDIHIKSLLISKFFSMQQRKIKYSFECHSIIDKVNLNIIDIIRLLSILLDNAIEETQNQPHGIIHVIFLKSDNSIEIDIENTLNSKINNIKYLKKEGVSHKQQHEGLGLSIIDDMQKKYNNLFVHYSDKEQMFSIQLIII